MLGMADLFEISRIRFRKISTFTCFIPFYAKSAAVIEQVIFLNNRG